MNNAQHSASYLLNLTVPLNKLKEINEQYNLNAPDGINYRDLLRLRVIQLAGEGNKEALKVLSEGLLNE